MSLIKKATFTYKHEIKALNTPVGWDIFQLPKQIKTASTQNFEAEDLHGFDIKTATQEHPDHLYLKIFAIKENEVNDNGDHFSPEELEKSAHTFVGVPLFTNHQNDDVEKSRGKCVHSWYDKKAGGIYIVGKVDKIAYPQLARAIEEGYVQSTSMGCSVEYSCCSICHKRATTADQFCEHIRERKNRKFSGEVQCRYHENEDVKPEDKCPVCGSTKKTAKTLSHNQYRVFEHNYGLKFIENSFVVNPACHDCGIKNIFNVPNLQNKIASLNNNLDNILLASLEEENINHLIKLGGVEELNLLKDSMGKIEKVVQSMLKQKENISIDYVSELVKAMADLQSTYDELNEMGYARLPSAVIADANTNNEVTAYNPTVETPQVAPQTQNSQVNNFQDKTDISSNDMSGLGTVTLPKQSSKKIKDFFDIKKNLITKVSMLNETLNTVINKMNTETSLTKEIGVDMATKNTDIKMASSPSDREVITEKQLEQKTDSLHPRTGSTYDGTTESPQQLGGNIQVNDTISDSPQVRKGSTYETITEDQLGIEKTDITRYNEFPDVITEKQWTDASRAIASKISEDYTSSITEKQIQQLLSNHKFVGSYDTITEDQLKNINMTTSSQRWANKDYTKTVMKIASNAIVDAVAVYHQSPDEIKKVASIITENPEVRSKISFLSIVNSLPYKKENRQTFANKISYFSKVASKNSNVSTIDALALSIADNSSSGIIAEDVFDAISYSINDKKIMAKINNSVKIKLSSTDIQNNTTNKFAAMKSAAKALDRPEDGKYQIQAAIKDIKAPITDKVAFCNGIKKFAQEMIDDEEYVGAVIKVQVGNNGELIIDVSQEGEEITPDSIENIVEEPIENTDEFVSEDDMNLEDDIEDSIEDNEDIENDIENINEKEEDVSECTASAKNRKQILKQAQMLGGEMGGMGGASQAPGAGASVPGMPTDAAPMENLTQDPALDEEAGDMEENQEPLPPGAICPVCGSQDVDVVAGKMRCNNCNASGTIKVDIIMDNWPGITLDTDKEEENEEFEGEGFEMPSEEGNDMSEMPAVAAMMKITPNMLQKIAEEEIQLGTISPATGSTNTIKLSSKEHVCLDTGTRYKIAYKTSGKEIWAQWEWTPLDRRVNAKCSSCEKQKQQIIKSLASLSISEAQFDKMSRDKQINILDKLKKANALKNIKTASINKSIKQEFKDIYGGYGDDFPLASCIEKVSRRFGSNAVALSGPFEGQPLADCVCKQLKKADIYTDKIAIKVADNWLDYSGEELCVEAQIRNGYTIRQAANLCDTLKMVIASPEDFLADELADENENIDITPEQTDIEVVNEEDNIDPFDDSQNMDTVSLELPLNMIEELDKQLDVALGENPMDEEHHQEDGNIEENTEVIEEITPEEIVPDNIEDNDIENEGIENDENNDMLESKPVDGEGVVFENDEMNQDCNEMGKDKKITVTVDPSLASTEYDIKEASSMKSKQGKVGQIGMDLTGVLKAITAGDKEISQEKAQDSSDIGKYTAGDNGSLMGHENETIPSAQKPSVPRNNATMGQEDADLNPQDKPQPSIPSGKAEMGHEEEAGYTGGDSRYTGGDKGQGKIETASSDDDLMHMSGFGSSQQGLSMLAQRILNAAKLEDSEAVSKDKDIAPISNGKTIGNEEKFDADEPTKVKGSGNESMIGHENETIGDRPDSPKDHPDIPTGNAQMGQEENDSEKTTKNKGTVIANGNSDSESEAIRVAGRMLQAGHIQATELHSKIKELQTYQPSQIKDYEKIIFANKKGLDTVSDGISQAVVINETSNEKFALNQAKEYYNTNKGDEITNKMIEMFSLHQQNLIADQDENAQIRRIFR